MAQKLADAYAEPANFLEIDVVEAKTTGAHTCSTINTFLLTAVSYKVGVLRMAKEHPRSTMLPPTIAITQAWPAVLGCGIRKQDMD